MERKRNTVSWLAREHGRDRSGRDRIFRQHILEPVSPPHYHHSCRCDFHSHEHYASDLPSLSRLVCLSGKEKPEKTVFENCLGLRQQSLKPPTDLYVSVPLDDSNTTYIVVHYGAFIKLATFFLLKPHFWKLNFESYLSLITNFIILNL